LRAAVLWAGPDAVVHGVSAAWWHGMLETLPEVVTLTAPPTWRRTPPSGVEVRRGRLPAADIAIRLDVRIVGEALAALEAAVALGPRGGRFLDRALQRHVRFPALYRAYCRGLGRHGSREAGRLIAAAADRAASAAERRLVRLLRAAGVPGWVSAYRYGDFILDLAFPAVRVVVEVDGWAWHVDIERFQRDRRRQNRLVADGWRVLRYTWHDLQERPAEIVAEIRAELVGRVDRLPAS
jgi:very-short-patch-repair endonuclease